MTDLTRVDLNLVVVLAVLLEERNVTRTAKRLSLTQPTVSGMLARLRELLGDPLFVRAARGLVPTPRAEALRPALARFLEVAGEVVDGRPFRADECAAVVRVAANDYVQTTLVVPLLARLRSLAPRLRVVVRPMELGDVEARLRDGELDVAITVEGFVPAELQSARLFADRYVCVVRKSHPIRGRRVGIDRYCAFDHVIVSPGGLTEGPMDEALAEHGARRRVVAALPDFSALPALLQEDDLIAIVPERFLKALPPEQARRLRSFVPPIDRQGFGVLMAWHDRTDADPAHRWLREQLLEVASHIGRGAVRA